MVIAESVESERATKRSAGMGDPGVVGVIPWLDDEGETKLNPFLVGEVPAAAVAAATDADALPPS